MVQIKLFACTARATASTGEEFRDGEEYSLLVFSKQTREEHPDYELAQQALEDRGWQNVELTDAAGLSVESLNSANPTAQACYEAALRTGFAALIFAAPLTDKYH